MLKQYKKEMEVYQCEKCNEEYIINSFNMFYCEECKQYKCIKCDGMADAELCVECFDKRNAFERSNKPRGIIYKINDMLLSHEKYFTRDEIKQIIENLKNQAIKRFPDSEYGWESLLSSEGFDFVYEDFEYNFE